MTTKKVVVVGADAAGMSAAHQALRTGKANGKHFEILALEKTPYTSYSACGIPYWVAGDVSGAADLSARTPEQHRHLGVDLRMGATATRLDTDRKTVTFRDADGVHQTVFYDELVLATGAAPVIPAWARTCSGELVEGVHPLKDLGDGERWIDILTTEPQTQTARRPHAIVVGGGYIGIEMAEALIRREWDCTLVTRSGVMSSLDPDMGERVQKVLEAAGITVITDSTVDRLEQDPAGRVARVVLHDGNSFEVSAVVLALGVEPATDLGAASGLPVGDSGGYLTDQHGRVSDAVWAAGDCCEAIHRVSARPVFIPLGTHANKQGKVVGTCLGGGSAQFAGVLGTAITRFVAGGQHVEVARTGLSSAEASAAGFVPASLTTEGRTASGYMPEASPMATKVIADQPTRRLLGLQIVGGPGAGKRIDTAAASLWGSLTVDDLAGMDLAYAPPFATVWEAIQLAARRLADRM